MVTTSDSGIPDVDAESSAAGPSAPDGAEASPRESDSPETDSRETGDSPEPARRRFSYSRGQWIGAVAFVVFGIVLFLAYLAQARTIPATSESGGQALQAWDMFHGNPLLRGWTLSDVSFYTTELPEYGLVELVRGLNADTVHVSAAISYTLIVLLGGLLAKGRARGTEGLVRFLIAAGIMLAPPLTGTALLLASPDHVGTHVPLLIIWLVLDRAPARWWVPILVAILLTWAQVADTLVLFEGTLPLAAACLIRAYKRREDQPRDYLTRRWLSSQWFDASLIVAALVSVGASHVILTAIRNAGGFHVKTPVTNFSPPAAITAKLLLDLSNILEVFGANFFGTSLGHAAFALIHLVGVALVVWAVAIGVRRLFAGTDLIVTMLTIGFLIVVAAFVFGTKQDSNEVVGLLPMGAVLAGRLLTTRIIRDGLVAALAVVLVAYGVMLADSAAKPAARPAGPQLISTWLEAHHLTYGLAGFWNATATTVASGDHVQVRPTIMLHHTLVTTLSESSADWYKPSLHDANFIISSTFRGCEGTCLAGPDLRTDFGQPTKVYHVDGYLVMVWRNENLLKKLPVVYWCGDVWPWKTTIMPSVTPCPAALSQRVAPGSLVQSRNLPS
jgi:hypothetical protein